jgi:hypothetical protein
VPPWIVEYERALREWEERDHPDSEVVADVLSWLIGVADHGPPNDYMPVPMTEDVYISRVPPTAVLVTYLVVVFERWVLIQHIG